MTEEKRWKSKAKYWCEVCEQFIEQGGGKVKAHNESSKHKSTALRNASRLRFIKQRDERANRNTERQIAAIKHDASKRFRQDIGDNVRHNESGRFKEFRGPQLPKLADPIFTTHRPHSPSVNIPLVSHPPLSTELKEDFSAPSTNEFPGGKLNQSRLRGPPGIKVPGSIMPPPGISGPATGVHLDPNDPNYEYWRFYFGKTTDVDESTGIGNWEEVEETPEEYVEVSEVEVSDAEQIHTFIGGSEDPLELEEVEKLEELDLLEEPAVSEPQVKRAEGPVSFRKRRRKK